MEKYMEKISTTLKHGIISNSIRKFFIGVLFVCSFAFVISLVATVYYYYLIVLAIFFAILVGISIQVVAHQSKARRDIKRWLVDAVELEAYCEEIEGSSDTLKQGSIGRVQVLFTYNGENKTLMSQYGANVKFGMAAKYGTGTFFSEYVNKTVKILYSPKYNEVMFLKNILSNENVA